MHNHRRTVTVAAWGEKEGKTEMASLLEQSPGVVSTEITCRFFKN